MCFLICCLFCKDDTRLVMCVCTQRLRNWFRRCVLHLSHYYFLFLFTVAAMQAVWRNTRDYATNVFDDMAGWIARHPSSRMRRWSLDSGTSSEEECRTILIEEDPSQSTPFYAAVMPLAPPPRWCPGPARAWEARV